ncbi:hypothetical protein [Lactiplantibacillus mudanjiangensis]|uniref:Uncharacterized protein n=1 Tax=Lactiplantibacillus mudanjiangensis TaxID=1296538 RepID=A0A660E1F4_9LACO|nr:hypothetical protein [Lactiplantibacillus mudanjiangensis]VDG21232.1 hypothetical protein [Lactobacillus brevis ATCC 367] [Lactiplantibacillus mudanjiangensis]VDG22820.1 hypothetical protein [Lactobacillus brevis ATCC 367] [Lactiplantibacillus mudanjiangensis]VDG26608.1 hypothetical protein [Lactobacillus brevis ATCC 367] [Lactiplantibacillus mudanjiangensis]VDG31842.1 hypothetical protein [Lactobacillus brevis ATCC 367] [Lactiplantibacillus mudanjiangensis]
MKKLNVLFATAALALPLAVAPLSASTTLVANAATAKKATSTTYTLKKAISTKKTAYHAKKTGDKYKILFAADRAKATVEKSKTKLSTKKTYTSAKKIELTTGKKGAKTVTYLHLKNNEGKYAGWVKASQLTKGASTYKAKITTKAKGTTYTLKKATSTKKTAYHATKAGDKYKITFAADRAKATVEKSKTKLSTKKTYISTKKIELTTGKKGAKTVTYLHLKNGAGQYAGWVKASEMTKGALADK